MDVFSVISTRKFRPGETRSGQLLPQGIAAPNSPTSSSCSAASPPSLASSATNDGMAEDEELAGYDDDGHQCLFFHTFVLNTATGYVHRLAGDDADARSLACGKPLPLRSSSHPMAPAGVKYCSRRF